MSLQSKMRSESFRRGSLASPTIGGATSPPADAHDAYLKQTSRLEELEKENKRLAKEAKDGEDRWRKLEAELDELRDGRAELGGAREEVKARDEEVDKLVRIRCPP
jgi:predicted RNase H-like nuclease (RuvC/YqgF family)